MAAGKNQERVFKILSNIFNEPFDKISLESSPDNIESWDSLKHMILILALEEEFKVQFTGDQIGEMISAKAIINFLDKLSP